MRRLKESSSVDSSEAMCRETACDPGQPNGGFVSSKAMQNHANTAVIRCFREEEVETK